MLTLLLALSAMGLTIYEVLFAEHADDAGTPLKAGLWLALAGLGLWSIILLRKRAKWAGWIAMAFQAGFFCTLIYGGIGGLAVSSDDLLVSIPGTWERVCSWLSLTPDKTLLALGGFAFMSVSSLSILRTETEIRDGVAGDSVEARPIASQWRGRLGAAIILVLLWGTLKAVLDQPFGFIMTDLLRRDAFESEPWWKVGAFEFGQLLVPLALFLSLRFERWVSDPRGIRFVSFGNLTLLRAPWSRLRKLVLIYEGDDLRRLVVHYRSRFWFSTSFAIEPRGLSDSALFLETIYAMGDRTGVARTAFHPARFANLAALILLMLGLGSVAAGQLWTSSVTRRYEQGLITSANYDQLAGVVPLTTFFVASVCLISFALGLRSGAHRGGSRILLLALLVMSIEFVPDPLLHWLVWMAIYSIDSATMTPMSIHSAAAYPPGNQLEAGIFIVQYAFVLVPILFWAGVLGGRRSHIVVQTQPVAAPEPAKAELLDRDRVHLDCAPAVTSALPRLVEAPVPNQKRLVDLVSVERVDVATETVAARRVDHEFEQWPLVRLK